MTDSSARGLLVIVSRRDYRRTTTRREFSRTGECRGVFSLGAQAVVRESRSDHCLDPFGLSRTETGCLLPYSLANGSGSLLTCSLFQDTSCGCFMNSTRLLLSGFLIALFCSCVSRANPQRDRRELLKPYLRERHLVHMTPGQTFAQGMLGVSYLTESNFDQSSVNAPLIQSDDIQQAPMIGGAFQHAIWGEHIDAGLEVGGTLGFQSGGAFVVVGGGGLLVAVDVDMLLFDLFAGPFVSVPLGNKTRIYGGAGPMMQFADWDQTGNNVDQSGSGLGTGLYARTGLEFEFSPAMLVGVGVRWSDSEVSLGGGLGNLDIGGIQAMLTFTAGT